MAALQDYLRFTVTLLAVLDPFLAVPIFLSVTAGRDARSRTWLLNAVTLTVFLVLAGAALFGEGLLRLVGASLPAFQVGGGLVLLLMALSMLHAEPGHIRQSADEAEALESGERFSVVPLAVPLLAGPGAISTSIIAGQAGGAAHLGVVVLCIALVTLVQWIVLRLADRVGARMGVTGLNIATRLLGLLLAALAIEMMAVGLKALLPGLA